MQNRQELLFFNPTLYTGLVDDLEKYLLDIDMKMKDSFRSKSVFPCILNYQPVYLTDAILSF
jgi:hypothetical protein